MIFGCEAGRWYIGLCIHSDINTFCIEELTTGKNTSGSILQTELPEAIFYSSTLLYTLKIYCYHNPLDNDKLSNQLSTHCRMLDLSFITIMRRSLSG